MAARARNLTKRASAFPAAICGGRTPGLSLGRRSPVGTRLALSAQMQTLPPVAHRPPAPASPGRKECPMSHHLDTPLAGPTWKKGYGFHPLGAWAANTRKCLAMLLRPGNAGSNTFADHKEVLAAAIRQVPARFRRKMIIRVDGAGGSHELIEHLLSLSSPCRKALFTCGWMITAADED